jgi:hypothetical protein
MVNENYSIAVQTRPAKRTCRSAESATVDSTRENANGRDGDGPQHDQRERSGTSEQKSMIAKYTGRSDRATSMAGKTRNIKSAPK